MFNFSTGWSTGGWKQIILALASLLRCIRSYNSSWRRHWQFYNSSLATGKISVECKSSITCPIYKKDSKDNVANYRPIYLTSVVCKILERIVKANMLRYLKTASILSDAQRRFMPRRSCLTNLIVAEALITGMTDQGVPVDVVYLNFSKALDSVCHRLLVKKMVAMRFHLKLTRWVVEFLKNRHFRLKLGGHLSSESIIKMACLRALFEPLLFLVFIIDLEDELTYNHLFFADDVKLIAPRSQQHKLRLSIQQALSWSRRWELPVNASKSHHLVLTHKIIYNQIDLKATQLFKFSRRPGLRRSAFKPVKEGTVLHAELLSTGAIYHLQ